LGLVVGVVVVVPAALWPQPIAGMQMASRRAKRPAARTVSLPRRRLRDAKSIRRPAKARVKVAIERERLPVRVRPLVVVREVVVKVTLVVATIVGLSANGAGTAQVTPVGAVPEATQVSVTVPVKVALGVTTRAAGAEEPAVTVTEVAALPVESARVKSGARAPVPVRGEVSALDDELVTTWSWPVAVPTAVGVKTTLIAQVAPIARDVPQALLAAKGPVVVILVMVSGVSPTLTRLTICPLEGTPTMVLGKVVEPGLRAMPFTGAGMAK